MPPSPLSLEQLRKQAKELTRTRRAADPTFRLADAQQLLARDAGFASWPALVRHVHAHPPALPLFETLAQQVADAYM